MPEDLSQNEEITSLGITPPSGRSKKLKIALGILGLVFILTSIPAAVYLVQQRQEIRKEAAVGNQDHCTSPQCTVTVGPDYISFIAEGHGTRNTKTPTINIGIPSGSTVYKAYAFWGGERKADVTKDDAFKLVINGGSPQGVVGNLAAYSGYISDYNTNEDSFLADITSLLPTDTTSFTFKVDGGFLEGGYNDDGGGGAGHGISIIVVYKNSTNPYSKIIIKLWDEFVLRNTSANMAFNISDRKSDSTDIRIAFFFGEGEGSLGSDRPNYLYYVENGNQQLNPTDGTPYPAYGSDPGFWWDTRITGDNLPTINALSGQASFYVFSPTKNQDPQNRLGDSIVWQGGIMQYPVTPPEALSCLSLTGTPDPSGLSPGEEVALTCTASSDPTIPINHFEFRVSTDSGTPVTLPTVPATKTDGEYQGQTSYTLPDYGCYKVECRACTSSDSSECTEWGQAQ